ncbi:septum formation family protein [Polymorphospora sp. NPDC050346]|uniref:septum formation family protein n=1 Tax=Polymorphospora sp. NPDC050346 TaxID=3155780 RepID=UPI0033F93C95
MRTTTRHQRARRLLAALAAGLALAVTGCGNPAGVDGLLTDDWAALPEPAVVVPAVGECHPYAMRQDAPAADYRPVDCGTRHQAETLHVGQFDAGVTATPQLGDPAMVAAFATCDGKAREWLGADWRTARLDLRAIVPTPPAWQGGARWFRCDVVERIALDDPRPVNREGSLQGALKTDSELRLGCFRHRLRPGRWTDKLEPVACQETHHSEFAGVHMVADQSREEAFGDDRMRDGCYRVIAKYTDVPVGDVRRRVRAIVLPPEEPEWRAGDRGVKCLLFFGDDFPVNRSMRDAGTGVLRLWG